jgi:hypothetical protein
LATRQIENRKSIENLFITCGGITRTYIAKYGDLEKRKLKNHPLSFKSDPFLGIFPKTIFLGIFLNSKMVNFLPQNAPAILPANPGFILFYFILNVNFVM